MQVVCMSRGWGIQRGVYVQGAGVCLEGWVGPGIPPISTDT